MSPKRFVINIGNKYALVRSCEVTIPINAKQSGHFLTRKLLASRDTIIPPRSDSMISLVPVPLLDDRDFLFHPTTQANLTLYTHIIDYETSKVLIRNTSDCPLRIPRRYKLGHVVDIAYDKCFLVDTQATFHLAAFPPAALPFLDLGAEPTLAPRNGLMETQLNNGVRVYRDSAAMKEISKLVVEYPSIWNERSAASRLRDAPIKGQQRCAYASKTKLGPTTP